MFHLLYSLYLSDTFMWLPLLFVERNHSFLKMFSLLDIDSSYNLVNAFFLTYQCIGRLGSLAKTDPLRLFWVLRGAGP